MNSQKLRVAWFSDMELHNGHKQPQTLSAYFSSKILPHLKDSCDITLYTNSFSKSEEYQSFHYLKAAEHDTREPYDIFFYQLEDDPRSNFVRSHIGMIPGVTYFHHFNLTNYGPEPLLNSPYQEIVAKFNSGSSDWPDRAKKFKPKGPAAYREAALSPVAIFSNPHSLNGYRHQVDLKLQLSEMPAQNAFYLPYPIDINLGMAKSTEENFTVALLASTRVESRPHKVLSALSKLGPECRLKWLVKSSETSQAAALLQEYEIKNARIFDAYNPETWAEIVRESDCALHPLFSAYGHLEPFLGISLSAGVPVMVTNFGSAEYLPDSLVIKIQPGHDEALQIEEALKLIVDKKLILDPESLKSFATEVYSSKQIAYELLSVFKQRSGFLRKLRDKWTDIEKQARASLIEEAYLYAPDSNALIAKVFKEFGWEQA